MINVVLIGAGAHSRGNHGPALRRYMDEHPGRVRLTAVCDLDAARAEAVRAEFGFSRAVRSLDALGRERVDALVAILPIARMLEAAPGLFARRLPVLVEKPLGQNLKEAEALVRAAQAAGVGDRVMVSLNRRFDPAVARAREWLAGRPALRYLRACMARSGRREPDFVWGTGIHIIDLVNHMAGPLEVGDVARPCSGQDQSRVARLRGRDGAEVTVEILPMAGEWRERLFIAGPGYQLELSTGVLPPWRVRAVEDLALSLDACMPEGEPGYVGNGTYAETESFLDAVSEGRGYATATLADALASSRSAARIAG